MTGIARDGYQAVLYRPEQLPAVEPVLRSLWGDDRESNLAYFRWKYEENPYAERPLGVAIEHEGKVVGFRGYFATRWHHPESGQEATILCAGDTCVDPGHRRRGLSVLMGELARREFARESPLLLNLSSSAASLPGYLRLGFVPVATKTRLVRFDPLAAARSLASRANGGDPLPRAGDAAVSPRPRPAVMARLASEQAPERLTLLRDERFFTWRYANPRSSYRFLFAGEEDPAAYLAVRLTHGGRQAVLVDHAGDPAAVRSLVRSVLRSRRFPLVSAQGVGIGDSFSDLLRALGFSQRSLVMRLTGRAASELPMLVRPLVDDNDEEAWRIAGLDARDHRSWSIRGICFDSS